MNKLGPPAFLLSTTFDPAAHPSSPNVVQMNAITMIWSFLLSLWKQVVNMSVSSAFLQIGRFWAIQKARLHWLHEVEEEARPSKEGGGPGGERLRRLGGFSVVVFGVSSMMVLFVKQVHLQNNGGAGGEVSDWNWMTREPHEERDLQAQETVTKKAKHATRRVWNCITKCSSRSLRWRTVGFCG